MGCLDQRGSSGGDAAWLLLDALTDALAEMPLLPSEDGTLSLAEVVLPTPILGEQGRAFADMLMTGTSLYGRRFPDSLYCEGEVVAVCVDYGARALSPTETLRALGTAADPTKAVFQLEPEGRFAVDPVLSLCVSLWERSDADDRQALQLAGRLVAVFPVGQNEDGTPDRIVLGDETAFYPPRSSTEALPLRRLRFLAHAVCWGSLGRAEQRSALERQMKAWEALFDVKEFRFEEVMRAAVLPGLSRAGSVDAELRDSNRTIETLATICRLAGKTTKPDQPLPMGRLGSDRAFFNLSRLEVPCRSGPDGEVRWAPAHRVYFGSDWAGSQSVEEISTAMAAAGTPMEVEFLAPPDVFGDYASTIGVHSDEDTGQQSSGEIGDDEVGLDDDTEEVLETTANDRWRNFFAWLGVSRNLRLIHFHDVDDSGTGWTSTKGLSRPGGWAFAGLDETWDAYRTELETAIRTDPRWDSTDHYVYNVHNLDQLEQITAVAQRKENDVAEKLMNHLVRNWATYSKHTKAELALVGAGKWPSQRAAPPRAASEERVTVDPDFWLYRLRRHAICPTSHGPRRPDQTWRRSDELTRRLGRSGRNAEALLPVLRQPSDLPTSAQRACLDEIQVRGELTPAAFTVDDARDLCVRISELYGGGVTDQALRSELRPIYRQMFELLVGHASGSQPGLSKTPLAARTANGVRFLPAGDVVYASVSGSRERSGVQGKVPLFVLEAEPGALAPLRSLFRTPLLENALEWSASPGEPALNGAHFDEFRRGLRELVPPLLARLSADRAERGALDRRAILEFVDKVEPAETLTLGCSFRGEVLSDIPQRTYYVHRDDQSGFQGFVVWSGSAWPPISEDAQTLAMALADTLQVNTVETFLSFINANPLQRQQLLDLAGAAERLEEVERELADSTALDVADTPLPGTDELNADPKPTDGESVESDAGQMSRKPPTVKAAPRVPLHRFEDLRIDGEVIRIRGTGQPHAATPGVNAISGVVGHDSGHEGGQPQGSPRAAAGTDLNELDRLGMRVTFAFEQRRFGGQSVAVLPGGGPADNAEVLIVDVSSPTMITAACEQAAVVKDVFDRLANQGISPLYPGFDILTIASGEIDRMIELKSSGVDAQVQAMSWNEWKTAQGQLRKHFWLYLVGNLRADLPNAAPFVRAVQDPIGALASSTYEDTIRKRTVQLRVREFSAADQLTLELQSANPAD